MSERLSLIASKLDGVADSRLGMWSAGRQRFDEADVHLQLRPGTDVALFAGCTPDVVSRVCAISQDEPWSNLAEHLIRSVNLVCGRYPEEGDRAAGENVLCSPKSPPGMALSPNRTWERGYRSRLGHGQQKDLTESGPCSCRAPTRRRSPPKEMVLRRPPRRRPL